MPMSNTLEGKRVAFLFTEGVEQVELTEPLKAARDAGAETDLVSLEPGEVQMFNHLDRGATIEADRAVADADPSDYDGLVLPGGVANPDALRVDEEVHVDNGLVTSRNPDDLPAFCAKLVEEFAEGRHEQHVGATATS
jgi:protease I